MICPECMPYIIMNQYVLGSKWKFKIIAALFNGHTRFNEICKAVTVYLAARHIKNFMSSLT